MGVGRKVKGKRFFFEKKAPRLGKQKTFAKLGRWRWRRPELDAAVLVFRSDQIAKTGAAF
jgi:hypothetical protein